MTRTALFALLLLFPAGMQAQELKEFSSAEGNYKLLFPPNARAMNQKLPMNMELKMQIAESPEGAAFVSYTKLPAAPTEANMDQMLDSTRDGMLKNLGAKVQKETKLMLQGKYPGREILAEVTGKGLARIRIISAGDGLYNILIVGKKEYVERDQSGKILSSFEITK